MRVSSRYQDRFRPLSRDLSIGLIFFNCLNDFPIQNELFGEGVFGCMFCIKRVEFSTKILSMIATSFIVAEGTHQTSSKTLSRIRSHRSLVIVPIFSYPVLQSTSILSHSDSYTLPKCHYIPVRLSSISNPNLHPIFRGKTRSYEVRVSQESTPLSRCRPCLRVSSDGLN